MPGPGEPEAAPSWLTGQTPYSRGLAVLALLPATLGLALGNPALLVLAAAPAVLLAQARGPEPEPEEAAVASTPEAERLRADEALPLRLEADLDLDRRLALVHQPLPEPFPLAAGTNVHLHGGDGAEAWGLEAGAAARGEHTLEPPQAVALHPLFLAPPRPLAEGQAHEVLVEPRAPPPDRVRGVVGPGRDPPGRRRARHGVESTDFRELREYVAGDPVNRVNWKATARESTRDVELMVNEFEAEARETVWFLLDLHPALDVGTSIRTALDDAVAATIALVRRLARRGHRVGGATYNGPRHAFHPEAGAARAREVARTLAPVEAGHGDEGLAAAAERERGFLARHDPAVVVVTRPEADPGGLLEGVRRLHALRPTREPPPVTVLAPEVPAADPAAAAARQLRSRVLREELARPGLRIRPLEEGAAGLEAALAKEVARW